MKRFEFIGIITFGLIFMFACSSAAATPPLATVTKLAATETMIPDTATSTKAPQVTTILPQNTQEPPSLLLSEPGPYFAGRMDYKLIDNNRNEREIKLRIWYPAIKQTDTEGQPIVRDAIPDMSRAPYPMILTEEDSGNYIFLSHLATHGFVLVVVQAPLARQSEQVEKFLWIEPVRDFLFTLDQISLAPPDGLESLIDTDHVGVTGYSYGGDISLAVSGARVDPEFYRSQCAQMLASVPEPLRWIYADFICLDYSKWDDFIATVGDEIINSDNGLWQPITDGRIRAVMPMAPTISWYFGERGLAFVDRPTLLIWGTRDFLSPYHLEAGYTFEHINIPDRFLISFIGKTHSMPFSEDSALRIKHFVTAFFGHYLQGQEDYSKYFSKEFVAQFDDLFWGVYSD